MVSPSLPPLAKTTGRPGFSIVELLVVMAIITTLLGLTTLAMTHGVRFAEDIKHQSEAAQAQLKESSRPNRFRPQILQDHFLFVFDDSVTDPQAEANRMAKLVPMEVLTVYDNVFKGFAAKTKTYYAYSIRNQPTVLYAERDQMFFPTTSAIDIGRKRLNADQISFAPGLGFDPRMRNMIGIGGGIGSGQGVGIAVLDTGADLDHPDLNIVQSFNSKGLGSPDDPDGHGTHVAGTIGAKDDGVGTTGVAPGASLWIVKVLGASGGTNAQVIEGLDYCVANSDEIFVANLSLGGGFSAALNAALNNTVDAGVVCCVAAGNDGKDAKDYSPASAAKAITIAALADSDGLPGGAGGKTTAGPDDTMATFSNYGQKVHVIAPGVGICSTYLNGGYKTLQGTSMASPHVAGMAAVIMSSSQNQTGGSIRNVFTGQPVIVNPGVRRTRDEVLQIMVNSASETFAGPDGFALPLPDMSNF